jgi:hypothetical protein
VVPRAFLSAATAAVAGLATIAAVSWTAATEQRGLHNGDLRSVVLVTLVVWIGSAVLNRRSASR